MSEIAKVIEEAKAAVVYKEGRAYLFEKGTDEFKSIVDGWATMTEKALPMPAFGVSIDEHTRAEMKKGAWIEFVFGKEQVIQEMPFEKAAEFGTKKVIEDHSTIGIVVTTDGSVTELPRANYVEAEERVVNEMKESGKPFVIALNCKNPASVETKKLASSLEEKYQIPVVAINALEMKENDIANLIKICNDALEYHPDASELYYFLGISYYQNSKVKEALDALEGLKHPDTRREYNG